MDRRRSAAPSAELGSEEQKALLVVGLGLILGPAIFLGIVIFLRHGRAGFEGSGTAPLLTYVSAGVALLGTGAGLLLPRPTGAAGARLRSWAIVRMALAEGGALFATIAYLLEGLPLALCVALLALAVMAGLLLPTPGRVRTWSESSGA